MVATSHALRAQHGLIALKNARGDLHLKVARGTMILSMISLVLSLLMILKGGGDASDALLDLVAVIFLAQYVKFGKTLMTMK